MIERKTYLPDLGSDPMDIYSQPIEKINTKLATIFQMKAREIPEKPGRSLSVVWDSRCPLIPEFENSYDYCVTFSEKGNKAGNHFHNEKQELFNVIFGRVKVILENTETKEKEEITLDAKDHKVLYVPSKVAHVAIADSQDAVLLVIATFPNNNMDEFEYKIN